MYSLWIYFILLYCFYTAHTESNMIIINVLLMTVHYNLVLVMIYLYIPTPSSTHQNGPRCFFNGQKVGTELTAVSPTIFTKVQVNVFH